MRRRFFHIILMILLAVVPIVHCTAVENNPTLAAQIIIAKNKAEKALKAQRLAQEMVAEGHVFVGREIQAANEYLREFNDYLDTFHDAVSTAAELYGTFLEIKHTAKLVEQMSSILSSAPSNSLAVMLKPCSKGLPVSVIETSLLAAEDIYKACISKQKMTAQQRHRILCGTRTKIKKVNETLTKLIIALKYTTLEDIWHSIRMRAKYMSRERKHAVIERCYDNWKHNIR